MTLRPVGKIRKRIRTRRRMVKMVDQRQYMRKRTMEMMIKKCQKIAKPPTFTITAEKS